MQGPGRTRDIDRTDYLYFFPDQRVTAEEVRHLLRHGTVEQRAWVISHLLRYAQWDEIYTDLDLPENLRQAWARMLKIEAPVG
jgi:hypothetical protein